MKIFWEAGRFPCLTGKTTVCAGEIFGEEEESRQIYQFAWQKFCREEKR